MSLMDIKLEVAQCVKYIIFISEFDKRNSKDYETVCVECQENAELLLNNNDLELFDLISDFMRNQSSSSSNNDNNIVWDDLPWFKLCSVPFIEINHREEILSITYDFLLLKEEMT